MPLTGWMMSSARNFPVSWFKLFQFPDLVAPAEATFRPMHDLHHLLFSVLVVRRAAAHRRRAQTSFHRQERRAEAHVALRWRQVSPMTNYLVDCAAPRRCSPATALAAEQAGRGAAGSRRHGVAALRAGAGRQQPHVHVRCRRAPPARARSRSSPPNCATTRRTPAAGSLDVKVADGVGRHAGQGSRRDAHGRRPVRCAEISRRAIRRELVREAGGRRPRGRGQAHAARRDPRPAPAAEDHAARPRASSFPAKPPSSASTTASARANGSPPSRWVTR